ncbi:MAG: alpha/beta hydrolase [Protaetiibacter sp.]
MARLLLRATGKGNQLFGIALLLATPVALTGVLAVPAAPLVVAVAEAPSAAAPALVVAADPIGGPSTPIDSFTGVALLESLGSMSRGDVRAFLDSHPDAVRDLLASPPSADAVAAWWDAAPASGRAALRTLAPELVGNLEGVPYLARDLANRAELDAAHAELEARLSGSTVGRAERNELETRLHMLDQIEAALEPNGEERRLVSLDVEGEGRAVIVVGDIAHADYVSYLVPGMFFGVDAQIAAWTDTAQALIDAQRRWLEVLHPGSNATVAAVAWIGYTTPSLVNVASMELAREGQASLTASLEGLRATRGDDQPYLSVLAHSYGSSAALLSLAEDDVSVDALAVVGSPGSPARSVAELHVTGGNVWVGAAEWDPIPASGVFGSQPASRAYGAHLFSVAAGTDPVTGASLSGAVTHNDYFAPGGMSLRNLALIGIGEGAQVVGADHSRGDFARALTRVR